jgi:hypothetical protein
MRRRRFVAGEQAMNTTDRPAPFNGNPVVEPGEPAAEEADLGIRSKGDASAPDKRGAGGADPAAAAAPDGQGVQTSEGSSDELAASLTDRLIQFWRTGEMGDGEFLPDEFYAGPSGEKGAGTPSSQPGDASSKDGASVLDFLPRRGALPELRSVKQRQQNAAHPPAGDDEFSVAGFGMFGPSADPFAASPVPGEERRPGGQQPGPDGTARFDDQGAFGDMNGPDRTLGLDAARMREDAANHGRRAAPTRGDSLWGAPDPFDAPQGQDAPGGQGRDAFEHIQPVNQFGSENHHFEGFETPGKAAQHTDDRPQNELLPQRTAPVVSQEERPPVKRKPIFEVAFIYGSALALAAAVMGAIYLSNEGQMGRLGAAGPQMGMDGMDGAYGAGGTYGMGGGGMTGYGGPASGPAYTRAFEVHDVVGLPGRPIALSIVLPKPLGKADAFLSIGGLPDDSQLSAGTRMATGFWMLRFEDIEGLTLKLPDSAPAEIRAEAAILRQDGSKSFEKNFLITMARRGRAGGVQTAAAQPERTLPTAVKLPKMAPQTEKSILNRANTLLGQGDISAARLMLEHGAVKGCVECGFKLAQICDPLFLNKLDVWGVQPDIEKALRWYAWSAHYGHPKASEAHAKLKQKILSDIPGN